MWGIYTGKVLLQKKPEPHGRRLRLFSSQHFSVYIPNILNPSHTSYQIAYEDGTDRVFRNVGTDAGELLRRKHTTFRKRRKFKIKNTS
jgi:hypothetical protein